MEGAARLHVYPLSLTAALTRERLRLHAGGACAAAAAGIYLTSPSLTSPWLPTAIVLFSLSVAFLGTSRPSRVLLVLFGVVIASAWASVPISAFSGGNLAGSLWLALLTSALLPLAWAQDIRPVLQWLTPVWLAQAGVSLYQWLFTEASRVNGIAENTNAGAAFLLLGCVYLMNGNSRAKWLVLPLVAAMPFSGSRWVAVVAAGVVLALFLKRYVDWRYIAVGVAATLALVVIVGWADISSTFQRPNTLEIHINGHAASFCGWEKCPEDWHYLPPSFIPRGFWDSGIHTVPWRMVHETGILSGIAWALATLYGLWQRPRYDYRWWLLLTVALLSAMYYFTWIGPLGWAWWLLVAPNQTPQTDNANNGGLYA